MSDSGKGGNRLEKTFSRLKAEVRKALIPFLVSGDPDLEVTRRLVLGAVDCGADVVELGIPFSDALADGPVIQGASRRALASGTNPAGVFNLAGELRQETEVPLVLLTYCNQLFQMGEELFLEKMKEGGVDGLIVPDLPLEESAFLRHAAAERKLSYINMVALSTDEERCRKISRAGTGFLYCVSVAGVTGARREIPREALARLKKLRSITSLPLALGFGISNREQVKAAAPFADGVIVGSALIKGMEGKSTGERPGALRSLLRPLREELGKGG